MSENWNDFDIDGLLKNMDWDGPSTVIEKISSKKALGIIVRDLKTVITKCNEMGFLDLSMIINAIMVSIDNNDTKEIYRYMGAYVNDMNKRKSEVHKLHNRIRKVQALLNSNDITDPKSDKPDEPPADLEEV